MLNEALKTFIQVVRIPAYISTQNTGSEISTIISAAADEGPDDLTCFPAGLHYLFTFQQECPK